MITESVMHAMARLIDLEDRDLDETIITEAIFRKMSADEWESGGDLEMDELRFPDLVLPTTTSPAVNRRKTLLLPTFVDYEWDAVVGGIWNLTRRRESVIISGRPGFEFEGDTAPLVGHSGMAAMDRAMDMHRESGSLIIVKLDDYTLSDIERMDLPGPGRKTGPPTEWLKQLKEVVDELDKQDLAEVDKYPQIPRKFGEYISIIPIIRDNAVMLFSKQYGEGFYIVQKRIDGMDWDVAIQHFYRDPMSYLEQAGVDTEGMSKQRLKRIRLLFRDYLQATGQGVYVNRSKGVDDIYDFANGEDIKGVPTGVYEHILRPTYFV